MDVSKLCRSCIKEVASWEVGNFDQRAVDMFIFCTNIEVTNEDKLPKQFCYDCTIKIESAYTFIKKSQEVNITLKNLLSRPITSVIVEPDNHIKNFNEMPVFTDHLYDTIAENSFFNNVDSTASYDVDMQEETYYASNEDLEVNSSFQNEKEYGVEQNGFIEKDNMQENYMRENNSCNTENAKAMVKVCAICQKSFDSEIWYVNHVRDFHKENIIYTNNDLNIQQAEKINMSVFQNTTNVNYNENVVCNTEITTYNVESNGKIEHSNDNFNRTPDITELLSQNVIVQQETEQKTTELPVNVDSERSKDGNKKMVCPVCRKAFVLEGWLHKHMLKKHNTTSDAKESSKEIKSNQKEVTDVQYKEMKKCPLCNTEISSKLWFTKHWESHHSDTKVYMCSVCHSPFLTNQELQSHPCSGRRFACTTCGKRFRKRKQLVAHSTSHRTARPYACHMCDKKFKVKSVLVGHLKLHEGTRPFLCHVCGDSFRVASTLECHMRVHTASRPHACPTCGYRAAAASTLAAHLRRHTRARTHLCRHCAAAFVDRATLVRHERVHTGARPYRCGAAQCGARFPDTWKCKLHMMRQHNLQLHQIPRITMDKT